MEKHLIEETYELVKNKYDDKHFTFKDVYDLLTKKGIDIKNSIGEIYIDMLQDFRFISLGKGKWALRENFSLAQIKKISSSMFGLDEYHEEDADKYMSKMEKDELNTRHVKEEIPIIDDLEDSEIDVNANVFLNESSEPEEIDEKGEVIESDNDSDSEEITSDDIDDVDEDKIVLDESEVIEEDHSEDE